MSEIIITRSNAEDELYHYGVPGMKWGRRKQATQYTKIIRQHQRSAAKQLGIANSTKEYSDYYNKKYKKAASKGRTRTADKFKNRSELYAKRSSDAIKKYDVSRKSIQKAQELVKKNSNLMLTYKNGSVYSGITVDGGSLRVNYSKAKVRANNDKNRKKYANKQTERGYNFVKEYYYYI